MKSQDKAFSRQKFCLWAGRKSALKSFTVIELLLVFAIISLIATIVLVATKGAKEKAKRANLLQFSAQVSHLLGADVAGEWTFNDGTANDTSGNGKHGSLQGGAEITSGGIIGKALKLDGEDDYVKVDDFNMNDWAELAVAGWVNTDGNDSWMLVSKTSILYFYLFSNSLYFSVPSGLSPNYTSCSLGGDFFKSGEWHFLVANYNGSKIAIWLDGKEICSEGAGGTITDESSEPLAIGAMVIGGNLYSKFKGLIDEVRVYRKGLSSAQIKKLYAEGMKKRRSLAENNF